MGDLRSVLVLLVVLQVTITFSSAYITREDVMKCINGTKIILLEQQNSTRTRFDQLKLRNIDDAKQHQDKKAASLNTFIRKERSVLSTLKKSAVEDGYNVSACNDSSAIYDLIQKSFNESAKAYTAEFNSALSRNYTQNLFLVNQFALNYLQPEKQLEKCGKNATKCFEEVQTKCENIKIQDDMENLESKFSEASEQIYRLFSPKIDNLYQEKTKEVTNYSQNLKDCYKTTKNRNGSDTNGNKTNAAFSINRMLILMVLPILFSSFA